MSKDTQDFHEGPGEIDPNLTDADATKFVARILLAGPADYSGRDSRFATVSRIIRDGRLSIAEQCDVWRSEGNKYAGYRGPVSEANHGLDREIETKIERLEQALAAEAEASQTVNEPTFEMWGSDEETFSKLHDGLKDEGMIDADREQFRRSFKGEYCTKWKGTLAQLIYLLFLLGKHGHLDEDYRVREWKIAAKMFSHGEKETLADRLARECLDFDNEGKPEGREKFRSDKERRFEAIDEVVAALK